MIASAFESVVPLSLHLSGSQLRTSPWRNFDNGPCTVDDNWMVEALAFKIVPFWGAINIEASTLLEEYPKFTFFRIWMWGWTKASSGAVLATEKKPQLSAVFPSSFYGFFQFFLIITWKFIVLTRNTESGISRWNNQALTLWGWKSLFN